jgi:heme oxygenase
MTKLSQVNKFDDKMDVYTKDFFKGLGELIQVLDPSKDNEAYIEFCNDLHDVVGKMETQIEEYQVELTQVLKELDVLNHQVGTMQSRIAKLQSKY